MRGHYRKLPPDTYQHICQQTIGRCIIFYSWKDRLVYYTIFSVMACNYRVSVLALALMFDHLHYLIKVMMRETYAKFVGVTTSTFVMAYNRDSGRKGALFRKAYSNSPKRRDKDVRTCIAYDYNNSVEKKLFSRAEQDRWNLLAYIDDPHPYSRPIDKKTASRKLLRSMEAANRFHKRNEFLDYPVVRKLFDGLVNAECEQLLDFIISLYLPIDREKLLGYYKSYKDMVIAINSNTGSEYNLDEVYDPESHQCFVQMLEITRKSSFADDPRSIILASDAKKWQIAEALMNRTDATLGQVKRFLHLK